MASAAAGRGLLRSGTPPAPVAEPPLTQGRRRLREELRYVRTSLRAIGVGADLRSRAVLSVLGSPLVTRLRPAPARVRIRLGGRTFVVRLRDRVELAVLNEIAIEDEYGVTDSLRPDTIVDLGAHVGLATLRLLAAHPAARVVAVEADPRLVERLRDNVGGLGVTVVHAAIGAHDGPRRFYRSEGSSWSNSLTRGLASQEEIVVPSITLAELCKRQGIASVDLLKVDIEGGEWELLADGIPETVGSIVAEVHACDGRRPRELMDRVTAQMDVRVIRESDQLLVFSATRRPGSP